MATRTSRLIYSLLAFLGVATLRAAPTWADVTVEQQMTMNAASIKITTTSVEHTTSDKQRRDSETRCGGFLSMLCGDAKSGDIVRLDKQLEWSLQPSKRTYTERLFPTPEERALAQQKMQAVLEQMKQCMPQQPQGTTPQADTSHCLLSEPKLDVLETQEHATIAGHDTRKHSVVISQTCTDSTSGDVCEFAYGLDVWTTQDQIPGLDDQRAFTKAYLLAQGLDASNANLRGAAQRLMAPYASQLKDLGAKASAFQGYPLRTAFSLRVGGEHCGKAKQTAPTATNSNSASHGLSHLASDAIGSRLSGLFSHHGADSTTSADAAQVGANAVTDTTSSPNGNASATAAAAPTKVELVSWTVETTAVNTVSIPADVFDIPGGWTKYQPPAGKDREFTCPANGK